MGRFNFFASRGKWSPVVAGALVCVLDIACDRRAAELPAAGPGGGMQSAAGASGAGGMESSSSGAPGGGQGGQTGRGGQSGESGTGSGGEGGACLGNCFPPAPAEGAPAASGAPTTFVVNRVFFGESDWDGNASDSAWQLYGFDLDGRGTAPPGDHHCAAAEEADASLFSAWPGGVDNSFGRTLAFVFSSLIGGPAPSDMLTATARAGASSFAISFAHLGPLPDFSNADVAVVPVRGTADANGVIAAPTDWSAYPWHPLSTATGPAGAAPARFPNGYVAGNEWVSAPLAAQGAGTAESSAVDIPLTLFFGQYPMALVVHHATITATISPDGRKLSGGRVGGMLSVAEVNAALHIYWFYLLPACGGSNDLGLMSDFAATADMRLDGSSDPKKPCDAISIGFGFEAEASTLSDPAMPLPGPRLCDGAAIPTTCEGARGPAGCCALAGALVEPLPGPQALFSCRDGATVAKILCPSGCGWDSTVGAYSCDGTAAEPTGEHPFGCGP